TFIHSLDPCPKGWDYDPMLSHELGELAIETGIFPLYEVEDGVVKYYGKTKAIVEGRPRKPVREYLLKQGRFAHFTEEDLTYFQAKVDEQWEKWQIPGVVPFRKLDAAQAALNVKSPTGSGDQPVRHAVRGRARYCVRPRVVFRAGAARRNGRARLSARAGVAPLARKEDSNNAQDSHAPHTVCRRDRTVPGRSRVRLGADQADRVCDPRRRRRRRRPDGAPHRRHRREAQALAA